MRFLGLDYGTKTLGIAISDKSNIISNPLKVINYNSMNILLEELKQIVLDNNITDIVLGYPKNMNNTIGIRGEETLKFKQILEEELNINIILEDERLTTVQAENVLLEANISRKKRKQKIDKIAATIILQNYLNRKEK